MTALRDPEQAKAALKLATETRMRVANLKRELADLDYITAVCRLIDVIESQHTERFTGAVKIRHLLRCVPHIGETTAAKLMLSAQIYGPDKKLRECTDRQRSLLVGVLESLPAVRKALR